ncbi:hypothetical protein M569_16221, partial [Genlisea aurea]
QMAYDSEHLRVDCVQWIGAFPSDAIRYELPNRCLLPLTNEADKQRANGLLNRCYIQREVPQWRSEIQFLLETGTKFEIEALSACSLTFLSERYLPSNIQR